MQQQNNAIEDSKDIEFKEIALDLTQNRIPELLPQIKNRPIMGLILYGSNAQPDTLRKNSDLDIKVIVNLDEYDDEFKFHYSNNLHTVNTKTKEVELKFYTLESLRNELLFGSFTRLFALLNAYKVLDDKTGEIRKTIKQAEERMDRIIRQVKSDLSQLDFSLELLKLRNYHTKSYYALKSEKIIDNRLGFGIRLFEYVKQFYVQFERLAFTQAIQSGSEHQDLDIYIKNTLMFEQHDGSRLLDYKKYTVDKFTKNLIDNANELIMNADDILEVVDLLYSYFDSSLQERFGEKLLISRELINEFSVFQTIGR